MKTVIYYSGKHQPVGEYNVPEKVAVELLKTKEWSKGKTEKETTPSGKFEEHNEVTKEDLEKLSMTELRKWAKDNGLKSKDNDKSELIEELLKEIKQ